MCFKYPYLNSHLKAGKRAIKDVEISFHLAKGSVFSIHDWLARNVCTGASILVCTRTENPASPDLEEYHRSRILFSLCPFQWTIRACLEEKLILPSEYRDIFREWTFCIRYLSQQWKAREGTSFKVFLCHWLISVCMCAELGLWDLFPLNSPRVRHWGELEGSRAYI